MTTTVSTSSSIVFNNTTKRTKTYIAETPAVKAKADAKKDIKRLAGRYYYGNTSNGFFNIGNGLITSLAVDAKENAYYIVMDRDRKVHAVNVVNTSFDMITDYEIPSDLSVLDYLKWHDVEFLIDRVNSFITEKGYTAISPVTVNYKFQMEKKNKVGNNKKKNTPKNSSKKKSNKK